jgi:hypothetical protein
MKRAEAGVMGCEISARRTLLAEVAAPTAEDASRSSFGSGFTCPGPRRLANNAARIAPVRTAGTPMTAHKRRVGFDPLVPVTVTLYA